jgi:hypothetical protein
VLTAFALGCGNDPGSGRHSEAGFSFVAPPGWEVRPFPGLKFKVVVGPAADGFAPNINVVDEKANIPLDDYVTGNLDTMQQVFQRFRLVKQDAFKTAAGLEGGRLFVENEQGGKLLRQIFYFFGKGDTKYVLTCTALAEGGDRLDPVFEASMKTFRFDP